MKNNSCSWSSTPSCTPTRLYWKPKYLVLAKGSRCFPVVQSTLLEQFHHLMSQLNFKGALWKIQGRLAGRQPQFVTILLRWLVLPQHWHMPHCVNYIAEMLTVHTLTQCKCGSGLPASLGFLSQVCLIYSSSHPISLSITSLSSNTSSLAGPKSS